MLELKQVTKKYNSKAGEVNALDDISLVFATTGMVFITGKSGSGKTTLLNIIGGLDAIDKGEIYIQDKKFSTFSASEYDSYRNTFVGFVFQEYNLLSEYSVEKNIQLAMELQGRKVDEQELDTLLKEMELDGLRKRKPSELSGGQRQRVAIVRALVKQPQIIMADEPTGALDSATAVQVFDTLKRLSKDKLVIVVSHDTEFAEKYADRIITLVDGKIAKDITFTEREMQGNLYEKSEVLMLKSGATLTEQDKDAVAHAVQTGKKIEVTKLPTFREKSETGEIERDISSPIALRKSQMKFKSSAGLGVKSLKVKPLRLMITILISALAFAMFGVFDTIATFNTQKILKNNLKTSKSSLTASTSFVIDKDADDKYALKTSQETVDRLSKETGGVVKGIFDFRSNTTGSILHEQSVTELKETYGVVGKSYYTNKINGFIEFDDEKEITNKVFNDFPYTIVAGRYPKLAYNEKGVTEESLYEVAISTYFADSILYYLNGATLNDEYVTKQTDLLNKTLTINGVAFTVVGLIDCGEIPTRYDVIKQVLPYENKYSSLVKDYKSYIDSGAWKCFFVGKGFQKEYRALNELCDIFYAGSSTWGLSTSDSKYKKGNVANYIYDSADYDEENMLLFSGDYPKQNPLTLEDNQVMLHYSNLEYLFQRRINNLAVDKRRELSAKIYSMAKGTKEENRATLGGILQTLGLTKTPITATLTVSSVNTGKTITKEVEIVGVYFGVDTLRYTDGKTMRLMLNQTLMQELEVYHEQGDYNKLLFSHRSVQKGVDSIVEYLTSDDGLLLSIYNNSVLEMIEENKTMVKQVAQLFLYATLALALFATFMLYNYISTSIANKRRSVGVLRGLGASGKDIFLAFLSESLLIALINGLIASVCSGVGCLLVNLYIKNTMSISVSFALFGARQVLLITGLSIVLSAISSALPIFKIAKKKPVELIRQS